MTSRTEAGDVLTEVVLAVFRLNGGFLDAADRLAEPAGLTAARWQVLGAVLKEPKSVADIARHMGLARQSVQRLADILAAEGLAAYADNPAHRRAKLLAMTDAGRAAIRDIGTRQHVWANRISEGIEPRVLETALDLLRMLTKRVEEGGV
ncbi:MarR family transcriptional regulator [Mesorhizobium sp. C416B]|uniref:MarR family winged helix-turn-helix transcriptional regulator n=1 Tax=unclassified Mesorhizobium TaxID=325217 RepID=UPI0003CF491B|nr:MULTISPECIES: MarR family transcriptional regulator [unclassified Mesorhizobium]ESX45270.1 MarR family transcriptional regulator [Mesorhizobium sp. LSHC426A00]ESX50459.1 MarR family transcriptional regulator [Mesorhizobium sp. LSHC424B00]ESX66006.1 MarR family transcriptional regulator [Mesorhizobium sp. LSHC416B00]WJI62588.1 MarR family transcriptional regulator [Mesorhizobium sp. C416B]